MESADRSEESEPFPNFAWCYQQNISDQHVLDFFVAFRGAAQQQHSCCSRDHIGNSDHGFLWNLARAFSSYGKNCCANQTKRKRDAERGPAFKFEMQ